MLFFSGQPPYSAAQEDLSAYLPTEEEMKAMFPWGQGQLIHNKLVRNPYKYSIENQPACSPTEVGRSYMNFYACRYIDEIHPNITRPDYVKADEISINIELIKFKEGELGMVDYIRTMSVEEWRSSERDIQNIKDLQFVDIDVGDKSYLAIWYWDRSINEIWDTKNCRLCFIKGEYYLQIHFSAGVDEKLLGTLGSGTTGHYDRPTSESYPTQRSVPTAEKALTIAHIVESRLSGKQPTVIPPTQSGGTVPDSTLPIAAGATALITMIGAWLTMATQGLSIKEGIGDLAGMFKVWNAAAPAPLPEKSSDVKDMPFTEADLRNMMAAGDPTVMSDAGSPAQIPADESRVLNLGNEEWTYTPPHGVEAVLVNTSDDVAATGTDGLEMETAGYPPEAPDYETKLKAEQEKFKKDNAPDATGESESKTDNYDVVVTQQELDAFHNKMDEYLAGLKSKGIWVQNPGNSKSWGAANMIFNPIDSFSKTGTAWRCEHFASPKIREEIKKIADETFGPGAFVDLVALDERSNLEPGFLNWLDRGFSTPFTIGLFEYKHRAIRVILPDGKAWVVDFWASMQDDTVATIRPEQQFVRESAKFVDADEYVYHATEETEKSWFKTCKWHIDEYGLDEGLSIFRFLRADRIKEAYAYLGEERVNLELRRLDSFIEYVKSKKGDI